MTTAAREHVNVMEKLKVVCSTDPQRTKIATPFSAAFDGRKWACGTDGHCIAGFPFDGELRADGPDVSQILPQTAATVQTTIGALRAFAGQTQTERCSTCGGMGGEDHECNCEFCDRGERDLCWRCKGTGKATVLRYGIILHGELNKDILLRVLTAAPGDDVKVSIANDGPKAPVFFRATDWFGAIMPMLPGSAPTGTPRFPPAAGAAS